MWSPNGKVWSPEMKNVESKILQSRSVEERRLDWNVSLTRTLHLLQMYILFTGSGH